MGKVVELACGIGRVCMWYLVVQGLHPGSVAAPMVYLRYEEINVSWAGDVVPGRYAPLLEEL